MSSAAETLHASSIIIDGTCPLLRRRELADDVRKLIGGNWLRVFRAVWGD